MMSENPLKCSCVVVSKNVFSFVMSYIIYYRALHIAVVQGELAIVCRLINYLLLDCRSLDIYNNLRQVHQLHTQPQNHQSYHLTNAEFHLLV